SLNLVLPSSSGSTLDPGNRLPGPAGLGESRPRRQGISPHALRHSYAIRALRAGGNVNAVPKFLGHASVATTTARKAPGPAPWLPTSRAPPPTRSCTGGTRAPGRLRLT